MRCRYHFGKIRKNSVNIKKMIQKLRMHSGKRRLYSVIMTTASGKHPTFSGSYSASHLINDYVCEIEDLSWVFSWDQQFLNEFNKVLQYGSLLNWHSLRSRCSCVAVPVNRFLTLFLSFLRYLRTLYLVWSLMRRRETRSCKLIFWHCFINLHLKPELF